MTVEQKGPGGVGNAYGSRSTILNSSLNSKVPKTKYDGFGPAPSYILAQSSVPIILAPNGTVAADGTITLGTALQTTYANAWVQLPAGAIVGGAAGLYFCTFSSTTVGSVKTLFVDPLTTAFTPYIPTSTLTTAVGSGSAYTQAVTMTALCNVVVPAGSMGPNGVLKSEVAFSTNNTANNKAYYATIGVPTLLQFCGLNITQANVMGAAGRVRMGNRGSQQVQTYLGGGFGYSTLGTSIQRAFDMSVNQSLFYAITMSTATDYVVLESFTVEISPAS